MEKGIAKTKAGGDGLPLGFETSEFCVIEYYRSLDVPSPSDGVAILLVLKNREGRLAILMHPEVRNLVEGQDLEYVDSLMTDFMQRARSCPEELFEQLCELGGVGPLLTRDVGEDISDSPAVRSCCSKFVEL